MKNYKIYNNKLKGEVNIPPSKSIAHRSVICASLSSGESIIDNIDLSDDILATINGMRAFGAKIEIEENKLIIEGIESFKKGKRVIDCNESGSTLRFLIPIGCLFEGENNFLGKGNLGKRPLDIYYEIFDKLGIEYSYKKDILDLKVNGKIKSGIYNLRGDVSSQFITGLLFVLPLLDGDSIINITTNMESKGYIDLTLKVMKDFGIEIINNDYKEFIIKGNRNYKNRNYRVEGDYSSGTFFLCANAIGNDILLNDLREDSLQGDKKVVEILKKMGVVFSKTKNSIKGFSKETKGIVIDASEVPDAIPALAVVSSLSKGKTKIINCKRLRIKECDRLEAIKIELKKLGAKISEKEETLFIEGINEFEGGVKVFSHNDHRISMMLSIATTRCKKPIIIENADCVGKSYPNFFRDFKALGGIIENE